MAGTTSTEAPIAPHLGSRYSHTKRHPIASHGQPMHSPLGISDQPWNMTAATPSGQPRPTSSALSIVNQLIWFPPKPFPQLSSEDLLRATIEDLQTILLHPPLKPSLAIWNRHNGENSSNSVKFFTTTPPHLGNSCTSPRTPHQLKGCQYPKQTLHQL
jgi:hypothetical protein